MVTVRYGGKNGQPYELVVSNNHIVVRTLDRNLLMADRTFEVTSLSPQTRMMLDQFELTTRFREASVEVLQARAPQNDSSLRDTAREVLKAEPTVQFAGRVLVSPQSDRPVVYTENFFIKFDDEESKDTCEHIIQTYGLVIKRSLDYARNAYFVGAEAGTGLAVFDMANQLLEEKSVDLCHPELITEVRSRQAFPQQWHLKKTTVNGQLIDANANVEAAWALSTGVGTIIAVVDDGMDLDHEEFRSSAKIVAPRDVTRQTNDPRPGQGDNHGTACSGVACANGSVGASGVAPDARLMPVRLASGLGSQSEADAFVWAARNGADVISCSWGPPDGRWWDASDPAHNEVVPLPDSTRLAMEFAFNQGRNGKGCVIVFAAGNGNESVDNDGYASYVKNIAVAACNDVSQKSAYSDFGNAVWCAFPSNDGQPSLTPGIWTTDRSGKLGYNAGAVQKGDAAGNYTNSFGGTSSACPGVAGVVALILARNPELRWDQVRDIIRQSCDKIDPAGGNYDANGHSSLYGYGRVNARKAVELALPPQPSPRMVYRAVQDVPIKDLETASLAVAIADTSPVKSITVTVDIDHTYIGDLVVTMNPPTEMGAIPVILHNRQGSGTDNLKKTYDAVSTPNLAKLNGKSPKGTWVLEVADKAKRDVGTIRSFAVTIEF